MYSESLESFQGLPTRDYDTSDDWDGPAIAYRLRESYEDETSIADRLSSLLQQPGIENLSALIIGAWSGSWEGQDSQAIVEQLVQAASRLRGLRHLFFGEITYEECEISWINQTDLSPVLKAFPKLESLRVRGGNELSFSPLRHDHLRELALETGGLPQSVIHEICACNFPALEHLELLLGDTNYGFDGSVDDLQPILSGKLFPRLKWLGLMNSEIANDVAAAVVDAPVVSRVEHLDLSLGNMDADGVRALTGLSKRSNLKTLNISHHYANDEDIEALKRALTCTVIADHRREPEDDWRPVVHAE